MLEIKNLTKRFGDNPVFQNLDLVVEKGSFCVLLGPSGCGKSTVLRCIAGLEEPSAGEIRIAGKPVEGLEPKDRDIAMVFQNYALYPHMTVRENMAFPLKMGKCKKEEIEKKIQFAADFLQIQTLLDRKPKELSGGQRQRVAIGRAIVRKPQLFLFDEPLSNLDAKLRHDMRLELSKIHQKLGTTIIYVTHDQAEAMTLADQIVVIHKGNIQQVGTPQEIYKTPKTEFVASFVGTPSMNLISGNIVDGHFRTKDIDIAIPNTKKKLTGHVRLGVRAEHVQIGGENAHGIVEFIEYLGADRFAHIRCGTQRLGVRLREADNLQADQVVNLGFQTQHIHFFPTL